MSRFEKWSVWSTAIATTATGVVYLWMKYLLQSNDPWSVINHPLQGLLLKAHIISAPLLVFALGLITLRHIWNHYRQGVRKGRKTGIITGLVTVPMILTGYLIQTTIHQGWLDFVALAHIGLGVVFAIGLVTHLAFIRAGSGYARSGVAEGGSQSIGEVSSAGNFLQVSGRD